MHPLLRALPPLLTVTLLSACGDGSTQPAEDRDRIVPPTFTQDPPVASYFLADKACQDDDTTHEITFVYPLLSGSGGLTLQETPAEMQTTKSLNSGAVKHTLYGRRYERKCAYDPVTFGRFRCTGENGGIAKWSYFPDDDRPLRVCAENRRYDRDAVEAIALTAASYLDAAKKFFERSFADTVLPKLTLEVLPHYVTIYTNAPHPTNPGELSQQKFFLTNNLAYEAQSQTIAIFPESRKHRQHHGDRARLWESPFVLAHEFGHHIEQVVFAELMTALRVLWNGTLHSYQAVSAGQQDSAIREKLLTAVSEAFADLYGLYASTDRGSSIRQLPTLANDRHPEDSKLQSAGIEKSLGYVAMAGFFGSSELGTLTPHQFGAILARIVHTLISIGEENCSSAKAGDDFRLRILMAFQRSLLSRFLERAPARDTLIPALIDSIQSAMNPLTGECRGSTGGNEPLQAALCARYRDLLPEAPAATIKTYCDLPKSAKTL